jgi:flagellin
MVVQHNLSAMNSNRQLGITTGIQAKSSEKLSSGYKINRAADDAAGLAISEKMRRQIRGLTQASANAQDGVSLVQIADGALHEVHDMIQRGNELAVKAANDTLTSIDRTYINSEIQKLKEEIDAIGGKTTFNEIKIFPPDGAAIEEATPAQKELANKIATEMIPTAMSQILAKLSGSLGGKLDALAAANPTDYGMDLSISYIDGPNNTLAYMQAGFHGYNGALDLFASESLLMKVDSADFSSANISDSLRQSLESTIAHELMHGVMDVTLPEGMFRDDTADAAKGNFPKWFVEGSAQLVGGGFTSGWNWKIADIVGGSGSDADKQTAIQKYLKTKTVEDDVYGHGYLECAYLCQLASGQELTNVTQGSLLAGANKIYNALMDGEADYPHSSFESVIETEIGKRLSDALYDINNGTSDGGAFVLSLAKASQPGDESGFVGAGSIVAASLNSSFVLGETVTDPQALYVKNVDAKAAKEDDDKTILYLQVGSETSAPNEIAVKRFAMSAAAIGVGETKTLTRTDALEAITQFKGALINVSTMRSYYGAMQNRLEHTIKNLDNVVENTQSAESRIRDTDMAAEMVRYSNNNILAQAGQSMLAQANQTNQGVLSLLQ